MIEHERGLPGDVEGLLRSERAYTDIPADARASLERRLAAPLGASSLHVVKQAAGAHAAGKGLLVGWKGLVVKSAFVVAVGGGAVTMMHRAAKTERTPSDLGPSPRTVVTTPIVVATAGERLATSPQATPVVTAQLASVVTVAGSPVQAPPRDGTVRPKVDDDVRTAEEHRVLDEARAAIVRGEPEKALDATAQHAARFPHGTLAEERYALRIRALARLGRTAEAEASLAEMRARYPRSFLLEGAAEEIAQSSRRTIP